MGGARLVEVRFPGGFEGVYFLPPGLYVWREERGREYSVRAYVYKEHLLHDLRSAGGAAGLAEFLVDVVERFDEEAALSSVPYPYRRTCMFDMPVEGEDACLEARLYADMAEYFGEKYLLKSFDSCRVYGFKGKFITVCRDRPCVAASVDEEMPSRPLCPLPHSAK